MVETTLSKQAESPVNQTESKLNQDKTGHDAVTGLVDSVVQENKELNSQPYGQSFTKHMWYFAFPSEKIKKG